MSEAAITTETSTKASTTPAAAQPAKAGLQGVIAAPSAICFIDGNAAPRHRNPRHRIAGDKLAHQRAAVAVVQVHVGNDQVERFLGGAPKRAFFSSTSSCG